MSEGRDQLRKGYLSGDANLRGLVSEGESRVRARVSVGGYQSEWMCVWRTLCWEGVSEREAGLVFEGMAGESLNSRFEAGVHGFCSSSTGLGSSALGGTEKTTGLRGRTGGLELLEGVPRGPI